VSIEDQPGIIDEKWRIGDWAIDTAIGKGHSDALATIVERVTNFTVSAQVNSESAKAATKATIKLLKPYKESVLSITADNGKEFAYHEESSKGYQLNFILLILKALGNGV
jgi:IS30 family transposase